MLNGNDVAEAPGADASKVEIPSLDQIETWLSRDLGVAISVLSALHSDAELKKQMSIFLQGRIVNFRNRPDPAQMPLFDKSPKGVA